MHIVNNLWKKFRCNQKKTGTLFSRFFAQKQTVLVLSTILIIQTTAAQLAAEPLRVDPTAIVTKGAIQSTSILTDDFGQVFIEIPKRVYIAHENDQTGFSGEIMPPKEITIPDQTPKTRMREVFSFELVSDSGETLIFSDKINLLPPRQKLRLEKLNDGKPLEGAPKPKLIHIIEDENVQYPKLWRFIDADTGWQRVGGLMKELDESRRIFSVYINQTGKYSIIDEDPAPIEIPAEMRQNPTYESIDSIEAKIMELEQIRTEIIARDEGLLLEDETGFNPEFLNEDIDIDNMTDAEFFDAFFDDEDFDFLEAEGTDGNSVDIDPWADVVLPSLSDESPAEVIPAEFSVDADKPLPSLNPETGQPISSTETALTTTTTSPQEVRPDTTNPTALTSDEQPSLTNQALPDQLPATGDNKTILQKTWEGFKTVFIILVLLIIPGYMGWKALKNS